MEPLLRYLVLTVILCGSRYGWIPVWDGHVMMLCFVICQVDINLAMLLLPHNTSHSTK